MAEGQVNSTAIGVFSEANAANATALGQGAQANFDRSTAIGQGAAATRVNQVALGTATNTYTMAGIGSADSLAAQDPTSIRFVTSDAGGNLALSSFDPSSLASSASVAALDSRVGSLEGALSGGLGKAFEGTAMALAMAGGGLPADKDYALSINWGAFEGENGFAGSAAARINENMFIHGGIGVGASHGTVGGRAGMTFAW